MEAVKGELVTTNGAPAPELAPLPPPSSGADVYRHGFEGMAVAPFTPGIVAALRAPIDPEVVEIKPDGIVYLPGVFYRQRLTDAFGPGGWAIAPRGPVRTRKDGGADEVAWEGALFCHGRYVASAMGTCKYFPGTGMGYGDAVEGAKTDCVTKCCKDLLIAMELWDPGWREQWQKKYAKSEWKKNKRGEEKLVWSRKGREQRLTSAPTAASAPTVAASPPPPVSVVVPRDSGSSSSTPPESIATVPDAAPSTDPSPPSDTGEAADDAAMDQLRELVGRLKWKAQFCKTWFTNRFGIWPPESLTKRQLETAFYLLEAWRFEADDGGDLYQAALAKAKAEGRCR